MLLAAAGKEDCWQSPSDVECLEAQECEDLMVVQLLQTKYQVSKRPVDSPREILSGSRLPAELHSVDAAPKLQRRKTDIEELDVDKVNSQSDKLHQDESELNMLSDSFHKIYQTESVESLQASLDKRGLAYTHMPCTFGHTVEKEGLELSSKNVTAWLKVWNSFHATSEARALQDMQSAVPPDAPMWGMMDPALRSISSESKCHMYYTPPKLWPTSMGQHYYGGKTAFTLLRDPYDRAVNDFRAQVYGLDSVFSMSCRQNTSNREGHLERESEQYRTWYRTCDVNAYLKAELRKVAAGDRYRADCHFLPQAEYLENPFANTTIVLDNRKIPSAFNDLMTEYGYNNVRMSNSIHNFVCNNISAYSLDQEAKELIKEVYEKDFDELCSRFGYCDSDEITCLEQIPDMCGGKPGVVQKTSEEGRDVRPNGFPKWPCGKPGAPS
eukprot:TRINITY_DN19449_c0_g1_i1.p1 TRINITY_DN19449_c0_g1~~TRINITY_DN19449_c0_g1_i1.p1  ORF type:complete len:488 (-),score=85.05 TRINITY_DN19449_c0_g1_i1:191-1510(-)